jgi:hypothetical protein
MGYEMRYILAMLLALTLSSVSMAAVEKVTIGPYVASFELNDSGEYTIQDQNVTHGENKQVETKWWNQLDTYSFNIVGKDKTYGRVVVSEFTNSTDATLGSEIAYQNLLLRSYGYRNLTLGTRTIDSRDGFFMAAYGPSNLVFGNKTFAAWYWLDKIDVPQAIVSYGNQKVTIIGNLSAPSVIALLNTLKIKKS